MLSQELSALQQRFEHVRLDVSVVMPDHVHVIIFILPNTSRISLPRVIQAYKSLTARKFSQGVREQKWGEFKGSIWQHSYHDSIISGQDQLQATRTYIRENPMRYWLRVKSKIDPT
jgi:REP element-mobilizing transposase RayT